jgi:GH24 family phage-related lysozyme (muramidase)
MKPRLKSSPAARALIKAHEPFVASARQTSDGGWTVGYGHRASAKSGVSVSPDEADLLLVYDILQAERAIDEAIGKPLGAPQRDALVSFALGIGLAAFRRSAVVRLIRKDRWNDAADAIAAWNGGGMARHDAERDLFLTDLPDDVERAPVELVIEFDHPTEDEEPPIAANSDAATSDEPTAPVEVETSAEASEAEAPPEAPVAVAAVAATSRRSELAERVILRMRTQLSGPVREMNYVSASDSIEQPVNDQVAEAQTIDEFSDDENYSGKLGFVFTRSMSTEDEPDGEEQSDLDSLPPIVGAAAVSDGGASGDVAGTGDVFDGEDGEFADSDIPLTPSDIDSEFANSENSSGAKNGWSNGDTAPAPGKNGGHLGEIILMGLGLLLIASGAFETFANLDAYLETRNLFWGPASLVLGVIFTLAVGIFLFGLKKK